MRYELVLFKNNGEEVKPTFVVDGKDVTKVNLNMIDVMTTNFENEAELLRFLERNGYNIDDTEKVRIRYVYDKKEITLDVCYIEDSVFSKERDRFDFNDQTYQRFTSDFISSLRDGKFVRYIKECKNEGGNVLYPELLEAIDEFTYGGREVDLKPIRNALTSYKQARDVYFLTKKYREKSFVNNHEANPYSSDEEEMSYQKYLENLPGDYEEEKHERIKTPIKKMKYEK